MRINQIIHVYTSEPRKFAPPFAAQEVISEDPAISGVNIRFKAIKQNRKIKTFVGTSANAVKTQVWTALIAMLVLKYLQLKSTFGWSLSNLIALLRQQLFVYRDLHQWLDDPFHAPPALAGVPDAQLELALER